MYIEIQWVLLKICAVHSQIVPQCVLVTNYNTVSVHFPYFTQQASKCLGRVVPTYYIAYPDASLSVQLKW